MKIVVAPDKFKGSLSAVGVAHAIVAGMKTVVPNASFDEVPVADGGDGTMDAIVRATGGRTLTRRVTGPDGKPVSAAFGRFYDAAVVELAQASGLALLPPGANDPRSATTYGTGELIDAAIEDGARRVIVAIGGSATNDAGAGALHALGARFTIAAGGSIAPGGAALAELASIDISRLRERLAGVSVEIATDVRNPLCGPNGASMIYGQQKGADPRTARALDAALTHFADVVAGYIGKDLRDVPGTGAAGGFGFGFLALAGASLVGGAELVLRLVGFDRRLDGADLVVTGEGKLDKQTLSGKTAFAVAQAAKRHGVRTVAVAGQVDCSQDDLERMGIIEAAAATPPGMELEEAMAKAEALAREAAARLARRLFG